VARTVIVGDVHGCRVELEELLGKVGLARDDRLVFVGDLVARGPDSAGVLALARRHKAIVVRGNHEEKLLQWKSSRRAGLVEMRLGPVHRRLVRTLRRDDWDQLAATPISFDLPEHNVRVVHAGVVPGLPIDRQARSTLLTIRTLGEHGEPSEKTGLRVWGAEYQGPEHIVFGHFAQHTPQLHPFATGIDTACVYGGALACMVLRAGEKPPRGDGCRDLIVSVPAQRKWYPPEGRP
jgi:hypothetical protein